MGLNTWAAFVGTNENAAIAGDVAMIASRSHAGVEGASQERHRHRRHPSPHDETRSPTIYFLHYWGTGPADKLATAFKAALAELGKSAPTAAKR